VIPYNRVQQQIFGVRYLPPSTYGNQQLSYTATCPPGFAGVPVTITIPANTIKSTVSVTDANAQALAYARQEAEARLMCSALETVYWNVQQVATVYCAAGFTGSATSVVPEHTFWAETQEDADALAYNAALADAQSKLVCNEVPPEEFCNEEATASVPCPDLTSGGFATVTIPAGQYCASTQEDADALAQAAAEEAAENLLSTLCPPICSTVCTVETPDYVNNTAAFGYCGNGVVRQVTHFRVTVRPQGLSTLEDMVFVDLYGSNSTPSPMDPGDQIRLQDVLPYTAPPVVYSIPNPVSYGYYSVIATGSGVDVEFLDCSGGTLVGNTEQTYTAECQTGFTGTPNTEVVAANTFWAESQAAANDMAYRVAMGRAVAGLGCTRVSDDTNSGACKQPSGVLSGDWNKTTDHGWPGPTDAVASVTFLHGYPPLDSNNNPISINRVFVRCSYDGTPPPGFFANVYLYAFPGGAAEPPGTLIGGPTVIQLPEQANPAEVVEFELPGNLESLIGSPGGQLDVRVQDVGYNTEWLANGALSVSLCDLATREIIIVDRTNEPNGAPAIPYPSYRTVGQSYSTPSSVEVRVWITHRCLGDVAMLLVRPDGKAIELLRNVYAPSVCQPLTNVLFRFSAGNAPLSYNPTLASNSTYQVGASSYQPSGGGLATSPAVHLEYFTEVEYVTDLADVSLIPIAPRGQWSLYVRDVNTWDSGVVHDWGIYVGGLRISN